MRLALVLALCLPALPAWSAQSYTCKIERLCSGEARKIGCMELNVDLLKLEIPDSGHGSISTQSETAELVIDRRQPGMLDMSYMNTLDGFRVVLQLEPETGRLAVAQLAGGEFELAELACTEAG